MRRLDTVAAVKSIGKNSKRKSSTPEHQADCMSAGSKLVTPAVLPDGDGGFTLCPELLTEEELIRFLRIRESSNSNNHHNVVEHLKRTRNLPRIHVCNKALYPRKAVEQWIERETRRE